MATRTLLLLKPVEKLGNEGDEVNVKAGYARNFLLPRNLAVPMTGSNRKQIEALQARRRERLAHELESAKELGQKLEGMHVAIAVKTGPGGKLYGSVTVGDLQEKIEEQGVALEKKVIKLEQPVKELGRHSVTIRLHEDVEVDFEFDVVSENPIEEEEDAAEQDDDYDDDER